MLSMLLTPAAMTKSNISKIVNSLQLVNDVIIELLEPYSHLIDWDTIPINHVTIVLYSKYRNGKTKSRDERWLESDEWMDVCNDMSCYDN